MTTRERVVTLVVLSLLGLAVGIGARWIAMGGLR